MKKFKKNEKRKQLTVVTIVTTMLLVLIAGISYAVYQREEDVLFINATVGKFKENDIELAIKLDGEQVDAPPAKDNYTVTVDCDNADGVWLSDGDKWGVYIDNIRANKVKCEVNFVTPEPTLSEVTVISEKTSISLSYTAGGIGTNTTCVYGKTSSYGSSASSVTNTKCSISGLSMDTTYYYKVCAKNATGEVCKEGNTKTKPNTQPISVVNVGDYISMTPTATSYTLPNELSGCDGTSSTCVQNTLNPSELNLWRVIRKNDDSTVDMVSEYVSNKAVIFYGNKGFMNLVGGLNTIAAQYTNTKYVQSTRHMGYSNQKEKCTSFNPAACPSDTGYETDLALVENATGSLNGLKSDHSSVGYWLASRDANMNLDGSWFDNGRIYQSNRVSTINLYIKCASSEYDMCGGKGLIMSDRSYSVRPIVTLKSTTEISGGTGTSSSPYTLK